jgi:hypothetical protein
MVLLINKCGGLVPSKATRNLGIQGSGESAGVQELAPGSGNRASNDQPPKPESGTRCTGFCRIRVGFSADPACPESGATCLVHTHLIFKTWLMVCNLII